MVSDCFPSPHHLHLKYSLSVPGSAAGVVVPAADRGGAGPVFPRGDGAGSGRAGHDDAVPDSADAVGRSRPAVSVMVNPPGSLEAGCRSQEGSCSRLPYVSV